MALLFALSSLALVPLVFAHGRITTITTSRGQVYTGWDPELASTPPLPELAAWSASNLGNIYVPPSHFNTSDIACHFNSKPGALHVETAPGETVTLKWNEWPVSHTGPVLSYLAACNGSCTKANKETLEWVKIDESGWLNSTGWDVMGLGGTWASDVLIKNNFQWTVTIPEVLVEGEYVLRHEIIALHIADQLNGAQAYPECVNIKVEKGGSGVKKALTGGVRAKQLYGMKDPGIWVDVHKKIDGYVIPGPKLWSAVTRVKQPNELR